MRIMILYVQEYNIVCLEFKHMCLDFKRVQKGGARKCLEKVFNFLQCRMICICTPLYLSKIIISKQSKTCCMPDSTHIYWRNAFFARTNNVNFACMNMRPKKDVCLPFLPENQEGRQVDFFFFFKSGHIKEMQLISSLCVYMFCRISPVVESIQLYF